MTIARAIGRGQRGCKKEVGRKEEEPVEGEMFGKIKNLSENSIPGILNTGTNGGSRGKREEWGRGGDGERECGA